MINRLSNFWWAIIFILWNISAVEAKECVPAYDFGQGAVFEIPSNPKRESLIFTRPSDKQVSAWIPTNFTTLGTSEAGFKQNLKIRVDGAWGPWGGDLNKIAECPLKPCNPSSPDQAPCMAGGLNVKVDSDGGNIPCKLSRGWGLYGLIAIDKGNERANPNSREFAKTLPNEYFRTFRIAPLLRDNEGDYFILDSTKQCNLDKKGQTVCLEDVDAKGNKTTLRGSLYFKIVDSNYEDNDGGYTITVLSGVAGKKGLIQQVIEDFTKVMHDVTERIYKGLTGNLGFITMVRAFLLAYVALSGVLFMMGMLRMHISELIIRLFKLGIVATLISETSWEFFNTYLFSFFTVGAQSIATLITKAAFTYSEEFSATNSDVYGANQYILPEDIHAVSVFDNVLNMLISPSIHKKIWAMLFYKYYFVYLLFMYVCIAILILAIIRSVMLYVVSVMLVALLLVISPIFLIMTLFQMTKQLFDDWLKQLLSNALLLIVVSVAMAIMVNLILNQLEKILYYKVCWEVIWSLKLGDWTLLDIWFWNPESAEQLDKCLAPLNFFSFLFVCILFNAFMQEIPSLIDSLASAALMPVSRSYGAMIGRFEQSTLYKKTLGYVNEVRSLATPSAVLLPFARGRAVLAGRDRLVERATGAYSTVEGKFFNAVRELDYHESGIAETDVLQWPRDKIGGVLDKVEGVVTPKNRGIFD